jgi:hypothetical protein
MVDRIASYSYQARLHSHITSLATNVERALVSTYSVTGENISHLHGCYAVSVDASGDVTKCEFVSEDEQIEEYIRAQQDQEDEYDGAPNQTQACSWDTAVFSIQSAVKAANESSIFRNLDLKLSVDSETLLLSADCLNQNAEFHRLMD